MQHKVRGLDKSAPYAVMRGTVKRGIRTVKLLDEILAFNHEFVEQRKYEQYQADKIPDRKVVILTCMDTRLTELLPKAMNLRNGDAKFVKNAGAVVSHPFGSAMRSVLVAIYELGAQEVCVIGHRDCGMSNINPTETVNKMLQRGIPQQTMETLRYAGLDLETWLKGFESVEDSVRSSVEIIRRHPLLPSDVCVHGLVVDPTTGKLDLVVNGYKES
jgi:carbonic anhydrase